MHVDATYLLVTTPAYMNNGKPHEIQQGIPERVRQTLLLTNIRYPRDIYIDLANDGRRAAVDFFSHQLERMIF